MSAKKTTKLTRSGSAEKNSYATPALEKGLDVIELLSHQPAGLTKSEISRHDVERRAQTLAEWERLTGRKIPADLHAHLARVKRQGFESMPSYKVRVVTNISYPIFDERGSAIGALSVPYIQLTDGVADAP